MCPERGGKLSACELRSFVPERHANADRKPSQQVVTDNSMSGSFEALRLNLANPRIPTGQMVRAAPVPESLYRFGYVLSPPCIGSGVGKGDEPRHRRAKTLLRQTVKVTRRPDGPFEPPDPAFCERRWCEIYNMLSSCFRWDKPRPLRGLGAVANFRKYCRHANSKACRVRRSARGV